MEDNQNDLSHEDSRANSLLSLPVLCLQLILRYLDEKSLNEVLVSCSQMKALINDYQDRLPAMRNIYQITLMERHNLPKTITHNLRMVVKYRYPILRLNPPILRDKIIHFENWTGPGGDPLPIYGNPPWGWERWPSLMAWATDHISRTKVIWMNFRNIIFNKNVTRDFLEIIRAAKIYSPKVSMLNCAFVDVPGIVRILEQLQTSSIFFDSAGTFYYRRFHFMSPDLFVEPFLEFMSRKLNCVSMISGPPRPHTINISPTFYQFPSIFSIGRGVQVHIDTFRKAIHAWMNNELELVFVDLDLDKIYVDGGLLANVIGLPHHIITFKSDVEDYIVTEISIRRDNGDVLYIVSKPPSNGWALGTEVSDS